MAILEEFVTSHLVVCDHWNLLGWTFWYAEQRLWFMPRCQYSSFSLCCLCSAAWVFSCSKIEMSHWHMCKHSSPFFVFVAPGDNKTKPHCWQQKQYLSCPAKCTLVGASWMWWWWAHEGRQWLCRWWWIDKGPSYSTVIGAFYELTCIIPPCNRSCGWVPLASTTWCIYDWNQFSQ